MIKVIILILFFFLLLNNLFYKEKFTQNEKLDVAVIVEPREHKYLIPVVFHIYLSDYKHFHQDYLK